MCERLKQAVLKTALPERVTGVRIPLPPPSGRQRPKTQFLKALSTCRPGLPSHSGGLVLEISGSRVCVSARLLVGPQTNKTDWESYIPTYCAGPGLSEAAEKFAAPVQAEDRWHGSQSEARRAGC